MRFVAIRAAQATELSGQALAQLQLPANGYLWLSCTRSEFEQHLTELQATLQRLCARASSKGGPPALRQIDTSPVGFVVLDRLLLTVHPQDATLRDSYAQRLLSTGSAATADAPVAPDARSTGARGVPTSPADLMLRLVNHMVDGFLALRRELTHQLDHWQAELINPRSRFVNWSMMLTARQTLHQIDEVCEDQRSAIQDWIEALKSWPDDDPQISPHERDMLQVRSRDVLEHIERVTHHVRQLVAASDRQ